MISSNDTVIKRFGSVPGSGLTQLIMARGIAVDSNGNILATDYYNNRILVIDPTLTAASRLTLPVNIVLPYPCAINLDQLRGRLSNGECGGQYRVLAFDGS